MPRDSPSNYNNSGSGAFLAALRPYSATEITRILQQQHATFVHVGFSGPSLTTRRHNGRRCRRSDKCLALSLATTLGVSYQSLCQPTHLSVIRSDQARRSRLGCVSDGETGGLAANLPKKTQSDLSATPAHWPLPRYAASLSNEAYGSTIPRSRLQMNSTPHPLSTVVSGVSTSTTSCQVEQEAGRRFLRTPPPFIPPSQPDALSNFLLSTMAVLTVGSLAWMEPQP